MKKFKVMLASVCCMVAMLASAQQTKSMTLKVENEIESTFSDVQIEVVQDDNALKISVNSGSSESFKVRLFDAGGKLVQQETVSSSNTVAWEMGDKSNGVYMLNISNDVRGLVRSFRITKK